MATTKVVRAASETNLVGEDRGRSQLDRPTAPAARCPRTPPAEPTGMRHGRRMRITPGYVSRILVPWAASSRHCPSERITSTWVYRLDAAKSFP
jgi:hypothetical protein